MTEIIHISGTQNYLADIISRNPAGLTSEQIKQLTRPRDIMVTTIKLNIDPQVKKERKELTAFQDKDPYFKFFGDQVTNQPAEVLDGLYAILDGVIHSKNYKGYSFWRPNVAAQLIK
jgi:hypothetical protein